MILCVNPNAAVDKTVVIENFRLDAIQRPSLELSLPGGKGCNVARAAKTLGHQPVVTGWVGGYAGQWIEAGLRAEGILSAFVHTAMESRACLSVVDPANHTLTEIYEQGRPVSTKELREFEALYEPWLAKVALVTFSGSLPPGVPVDFYARLIRRARAAGVYTILDSSGVPLRVGLEEGRPDLVKCNRTELSEVVGSDLADLPEVREAAGELSRRLGLCVVITLGSSGAVAVDGAQGWLVRAPRIEAVSTVGSGDAFLAGLACARLEQRPMAEMLRLAAAAGAANALQLGAGRLDSGDVGRLAGQVEISTL
jgi:1-phosphofructokinase family hexose kinase